MPDQMSDTSLLTEQARAELEKLVPPTPFGMQVLENIESYAKEAHRLQDPRQESGFIGASTNTRSINFQFDAMGPNDRDLPVWAAFYPPLEGLGTEHIGVFVDWDNEAARAKAIQVFVRWILEGADLEEIRTIVPFG